MIDFKSLHNKHKDGDIYVIGSGPSLNFIDKDFFSNKTTIVVNYACNHLDNYSYLVAKEPQPDMHESVKKNGAILVIPKRKFGHPPPAKVNPVKYPQHTTIFGGLMRSKECFKPENLKSQLYMSDSTITTGIHLAAFLGAKNVILVGHDCGYLDGEIHVKGYSKKHSETSKDKYPQWMKNTGVEKQTIDLKNRLHTIYGVNIYSLNPFINFGLEGHKYTPF